MRVRRRLASRAQRKEQPRARTLTRGEDAASRCACKACCANPIIINVHISRRVNTKARTNSARRTRQSVKRGEVRGKCRTDGRRCRLLGVRRREHTWEADHVSAHASIGLVFQHDRVIGHEPSAFRFFDHGIFENAVQQSCSDLFLSRRRNRVQGATATLAFMAIAAL